MKEIKAFIQTFMLHRVLDALHEIEGLPAVTISEVRGVSLKRHEYSQVVRSRLEIMVADNLVDKVLCAIQTHAHTGKPGGAPSGSVPHLHDSHRNHCRHSHRRTGHGRTERRRSLFDSHSKRRPMTIVLSTATRRLVVLCGLTLSTATLSAPARADEGNSHRIDRFISDPGLLIYSAAGVGLPLLTDGKAGREQSLRTVDALLVGGIAETALKRLTREKRPEGSGYSFPSGHAVASFAVATMQSHYHPKQAPFWYAGAALISASRVTLRRHYVHDVLAGAALGYGIARFELKRPRGILLTPFIPDRRDRKGGGFGLQLTKQF